MNKKRVVDKDCNYESFKFEEELHSDLIERKLSLGQSIEYQVNEAVEEFQEKYAYQLEGRKIKKIVYRGRTFKFKNKLHSIFMLRKELLGQNKDWQMNEAVREYLKNHFKELEEKEKGKEARETKEKDENPKQESKQGDTS